MQQNNYVPASVVDDKTGQRKMSAVNLSLICLILDPGLGNRLTILYQDGTTQLVLKKQNVARFAVTTAGFTSRSGWLGSTLYTRNDVTPKTALNSIRPAGFLDRIRYWKACTLAWRR
ncbi:MAG: hypothetical protein AB7E52_02135 [Bdellovibrionales bacterium]